MPTPQKTAFGWRVFFGRRITGISHIFYVELDHNFGVLRESNLPVLSPGERGCFDDSGVMPSGIMGDCLLYTGWSRDKGLVPYGHGIGMARWEESARGFRRLYQGPILDRCPEVPFLANSAVPCASGDSLLFCNGTSWIDDFATYGIFRVDGLFGGSRKFSEIISDKFSARSRPTLMGHGKIAYAKKQAKTPYQIFLYESGKEEMCLSASGFGWDSQMVCYPCFVDGFVFYNGNDYGKTGIGVAEVR